MTDFAARRRLMVDTQVRPSDVTKFPVIDAMLSIARETFVDDSRQEMAYVGENLDLGGNRVLLAPRTLAKMLDGLDISDSDLVMDIGCGYGYSAAVAARMAQAVVAVEDDDIMAAEAQELLSAAGADNAILHKGTLAAGARELGPYDVIVVNGGVEELPATLESQLKDGGRIACIFMQGALGEVRIGHKSGGTLTWRYAFNAGAPMLAGFEKQRAFAL